MSKGPETRFYTAVHKLLPRSLHREKMHNPYRGGTADVWYSGNKADLWVEYKFISKVPKAADIAVVNELSALQLDWLRKRWEEGRNVIVILGTPVGSWIYENRDWEHKLLSPTQLKELGKSKADVARYIATRTLTDDLH